MHHNKALGCPPGTQFWHKLHIYFYQLALDTRSYNKIQVLAPPKEVDAEETHALVLVNSCQAECIPPLLGLPYEKPPAQLDRLDILTVAKD